MTTMLSDVATSHAEELRALLDDGVLAAAGTIEIAPGVYAYADQAAREILSAIDRLRSAGTTDPEAWGALETELEQVYRAVKRHV
jgi:hypothetical protein